MKVSMEEGRVIFYVRCNGRLGPGVPALKDPVDVLVKVDQVQNYLNLTVDCIHNAGGHGQYCKAAKPVSEKVLCPYTLDIPYQSDKELVR